MNEERLVVFGPEVGRRITHFGSDFVMSPILVADRVSVTCIRLEPGGRVGRHPALTHQLFALVSGEGWVLGEQGRRVHMREGQAVKWMPGEEHEAGTDFGMTVIVVEGDVLGAFTNLGWPNDAPGDGSSPST